MQALHSSRRPRLRYLRGALVTLVAVLTCLATVSVFISHMLLSNITEIPNISKLSKQSVRHDPIDPAAGRSLTFLLIGTDSRQGEANHAIGGGDDDTIRSDTTIVLKIAADRQSAIMTSVPRDALVDIPECELSNGRTLRPRYHEMFNSAFSYAADASGNLEDGVACTVKTFKELTDIPLDGVVVADFSGFSKVVDAIGGVNVCLRDSFKPYAVGDFALPPGKSTLNGPDAIQFVRARKGVGDGSDTQRQTRQHYFLKNAWRRVNDSQVLYNPLAALNLLESIKGMLQFSSSISDPGTLVGLGYSLRDLRPSDIHSVRVPYYYVGPRVEFSANADELWKLFMPTTLEEERAALAAKLGSAETPDAGASPDGTLSESSGNGSKSPQSEGGSTSSGKTPATPQKPASTSDLVDEAVKENSEASEFEEQGLLDCPQN